jgi:ribose-phosphate pyrophosphokinase
MILFTTTTARHFAKTIQSQHGNYVIKSFNDGELFIKITDDVKNKPVWIIASTQSPAENLIELVLLMDALQRAGATLNVIITYFSYARQINAQPGEALSAEVISNMFNNFSISQLFIVHPHNLELEKFLSFKPIIDIDFFYTHAQNFDVIAAPDTGAIPLAQQIATQCNKELITITKTRSAHEEVKILSIESNVKNKKILLIDDMISTGHTLISAAQELKKQGASEISAVATHGIFSPGSHERIENSILKNVYVTNTIDQQSKGKINVIDISSTLNKIVQPS